MEQQAKPLATTNSNWLVSLEKKRRYRTLMNSVCVFHVHSNYNKQKISEICNVLPKTMSIHALGVSLCVYWCNAFVLKSNIGCIVTASILPTWSTKNNQFEIFNWLLTVAIECIRRTLQNGKGTEMLFLVFGFRKSDGVKWCNQIQMMTP